MEPTPQQNNMHNHTDSPQSHRPHLPQFFRSWAIRWMFFSLGGIIIALVIFWAGMVVGFRKASFSYEWGRGYYQNFAGGRGPLMMIHNRSGALIGSHGAAGVVLSISQSGVVVQGRDGIERSIAIASSTIIRQGDTSVTIGDLHQNDHVIIIGDPNQSGQIVARFIRIIPSDVPFPFVPPSSASSTSSTTQ